MGIALITNNILSDSGTAVAGLVPTSRTISTTAPLTGGGDLSADRTFAIPAATTSINGYLTSADWTTFNGKQSALSFTAPLVNTTGTISIPAATTSVNGYLTSTDWTTFNNKQAVLTNPVTGSGTTNYVPKFTGASTVGNSLVFDNGTNVGIGTATPTDLLTLYSASSSIISMRDNVVSNAYGGYIKGYGLSGSGGRLDLGVIDANTYRAGITITEQSQFINFFTNSGTLSQKMSIIPNGNVIIQSGGTFTDAGYKLDVNGTGRFSGALTGTSASFSGIVSVAAFTTSDLSASTQLNLTRTATQFSGIAIRGSVAADRAIFSVANDDALYIGRNPGGGGAWTKQVAFLDNGNVGIGTTTPIGALEVVSSSAYVISSKMNVTIGAFMNRFTNGNTEGIFLGHTGSDNGSITGAVANTVWIGADYISTASYRPLALATGGIARINITSGGNVLIGTATDAGQKFQVSGTSYFTGTTTIGQTAPSGSVNGIYFRVGVESGIVVTSDVALQLSRLGTTGIIQTFYSGTTRVGQISVTGTTVSLESNASGGLSIASTGAATFSSSVSSTTLTTTSATWNAITVTGSGGSTVPVGIYVNTYPTTSTYYFAQYGGNWSSAGTWGFGPGGTSDNTIYFRQASSGVLSGTCNLNISGSVTATAFYESSDATIKTLITDNYQAKGIESIVAKLYTKNGKEELGYFAQDVQGILPSAVSKGTDGLLSLSYREVHTAKIARLEKRVEELEQLLNLN